MNTFTNKLQEKLTKNKLKKNRKTTKLKQNLHFLYFFGLFFSLYGFDMEVTKNAKQIPKNTIHNKKRLQKQSFKRQSVKNEMKSEETQNKS